MPGEKAMQFYIDEQGNRYRVDRETGQKVLIQSSGSETGEVGDPQPTAGVEQED